MRGNRRMTQQKSNNEFEVKWKESRRKIGRDRIEKYKTRICILEIVEKFRILHSNAWATSLSLVFFFIQQQLSFPLHLKLIIRLLLCHSSVPSHLLPASIEKLGCFVREPQHHHSPLEKQPRKVSFRIKNPLDLWHLMLLSTYTLVQNL